MDTRDVAREYRLQQWSELLLEQKNSGLSIRAWCEARGINGQRFFYWQRKLRVAALEELADQGEKKESAPEGWALCTTKPAMAEVSEKAVAMSSEQLTVEAQGLRITVGSAYPVEQLTQLLRELCKGC